MMSSEENVRESLRPHGLCHICKSFWSKVTHLGSNVREESRNHEHDLSWPEHIMHSRHGSETRLSASNGCHFCSIILGSITGCTGNHEQQQYDYNQPIYISIAVLDENAGTFILTLFACEQEKIYSHDQILNSFQLRLCPLTDSAEIPNTNDQSSLSMWQTSTFSRATSDFIRSWLHDCHVDHLLCGVDMLNLLRGSDHLNTRPRRVLDLQAFTDPNLIRLLELEDGMELEYCCLSYSWGFSEPYVMTSTNLAEFLREIRVADLPNLIREAIEVVRGIGFQYLWIDALCIMQDGRASTIASDDWYDQVSKLNDIFDSSVFTIAASESFDGNGSLIRHRNPLSQTSCRLDLDVSLPYEVITSCTPRCDSHRFDNARYHLDTRAWVFQERILSPRTVHMTRNFIHLECRTELRCEASLGSQCSHSGAVAKADYHNLFAMAGLNGLEHFATGAFLSYWHELIRRYSMTSLSRPSDFLIAISGLIRRVEEKLQLTSSFGLWREHLLHEMLWYARGGGCLPHRERAPSWSWASIGVQGAQIMWDPSLGIVFAAEVVDIPGVTDSSQPNALSAEHGRYSVKIAGKLRHGALGSSNGSSNMGHDSQIHMNCRGSALDHPQCPIHPDYELSDSIQYCSLLIARIFGQKRNKEILQCWETEIGIVLTPVQGSQYQRVGYFHHDIQRTTDGQIDFCAPSLFEYCEVQEMVIV